MTEAETYRLIASWRLSKVDAMTSKGMPAWTLDTLLKWLNIPEIDFIDALPNRTEDRGLGQCLSQYGGF